LLGGPLVAAVLVLELAVIRRLPLPATLPGLLAASVGYVVFAGTDRWTGITAPSFDLGLTPATEISLADVAAGLLAGAAVIALLAAVEVVARAVRIQADRRPPVLSTALAGVGVAAVAVAFQLLTGESVSLVLFSGQAATGPVIASGAQWGLGVLIALLVAKAVAYALSLGGGFRGGAIFPAIMLGAICATAMADLPWSADPSLAAALAIAAAVAAVIRMPFTATVLAIMLVGATAEVSVVAGLGALLGTLLSRATPPDQPDESEAPPAVTADGR
jgi:H+/Cl- antiporter ClcA